MVNFDIMGFLFVDIGLLRKEKKRNNVIVYVLNVKRNVE